ncbi:MAG TPA: HAD family phosphatase [Candidatus Saccharimonadales bacterium]|nr:HAD family phosphatase [Candidatus Saccharimonadales bacterium]
MIKALIFDCFGVIVGKGFTQTYSGAGGDPVKDRAFIKDILAQANLGLITDAEFNAAISDRLKIDSASWQAAVTRAEMPDKQLLKLIEDLRTDYKTAVLSNSNKGVLERKIGRDWLDKCFDEVVASAEVGLVKPDPKIYQLTASRLGVRTDECIFVDDISSFLESAQTLGMKTIRYFDFQSFKIQLDVLLGDNPEI